MAFYLKRRIRRDIGGPVPASSQFGEAPVAMIVAISMVFLGGIGCGGNSGSGPAPTTPAALPNTPLSLTEGTVVCDGPGSAVVLIVSPALIDGIRAGLTTFEQSLCGESYAVIEELRGFASPGDLRGYLARLYGQTGRRLEGVVLVGNHPRAYQWVTSRSSNPSFPATSDEVISYQYYSDLDGVFDSSPTYRSPGGHSWSFDLHTGEVNWEIWTSVLPLYRDSVGLTIQALNRYFAKNLAYRTTPRTIPRAFLQVSEHWDAKTLAEQETFMAQMRDGQFSWTPFSNASNARLSFDSAAGGLSVDQGYAGLSAGVADFAVTDAHGFWGASGRLTTSWAESAPVRTLFYWSNGCAVGDLDHPRNFLTAMLYSPTSEVLAAKGTTNNSGGMGSNRNGFFGHNIATAMSRGEGLGRALLEHVNVPLAWPWSESREFHFATSVTLGDGTLKIRP
jgi:hypothetical protein